MLRTGVDFFNQYIKIFGLLLLSILFLYFSTKGTLLNTDSLSYIQNEIIRSPLYPLFLDGIEWFFGKENFTSLPTLQLLLGFFACYWMASFIQKIYKLPDILFLVSFSVLATPYLLYFGNHMMSEGLAYPLFLITIRLLFESLLLLQEDFCNTSPRKATRYFYFFLLALSLLILTRRQYLFLYVVAFIGFLYHFIYAKSSLRSRLSLLFALLATVGVTDLAERSYQYYYNGHFTTVPFVGLQLMTMPLYLSSDKDLSLYSDSKEAAVFKTARTVLKENHYDINVLLKEDERPEYFHYYLNYNNVSWKTLHHSLLKNNINDWIEIDALLKNMCGPLLKVHWKRAASLYFLNVVTNMGGYYHFIFMLIAFVMSIYFHLQKPDKLSLGIFLAILMSYGNYFFVALVEPAMNRYTFSTNVILVMMLVITFYYGLLNYFRQSSTPSYS